MSYSNGNGYDFCKGCFKQKQFCACPTSNSSDLVHPEEPCDQTFTEHNPSCQSIGEQEQQQLQQQGGLEQTQGPQTQDQIQEGQRQGPQVQKQTQGPQTQGNQTEDQDQTQGSQSQNQTEDQDQTQGPQLQAQRHGDQTMNNNQSISTPVTVDGVTINVKCGDCQPIICPDCFKKHKDRNHCERGCSNMENCNCGQCKEDACCNCCERNLANLLNGVRQVQATTTVPNPIDIFFSAISTLSNPTTGQTITNVMDCSTVSFRGTTIIPNTRVQLCDVAGICVADTSPDVFQFLLQQINAPTSVTEDCKCDRKEQPCICPSCATGIGQELMCAANFGLQVNIFIRGLVTNPTPPLPNFVLTVKDCLAFLGNAPINPTEICVFSLCAITGFTVPSQTL